jgi:hypothetical protein
MRVHQSRAFIALSTGNEIGFGAVGRAGLGPTGAERERPRPAGSQQGLKARARAAAAPAA